MAGEPLRGRQTVFDRPQGVFKFALAAAISAVISPVFGVTSLALDGFADWTNYGGIWVTWWLGDARRCNRRPHFHSAGSPLGHEMEINLEKTGSGRSWRPPSVVDGIERSCLRRMAGDLSQKLSHRFICGPIVIWTAFRFTQRETA